MDNLDEMELKLLRKMNQEKDAEITSLKEENERWKEKAIYWENLHERDYGGLYEIIKMGRESLAAAEERLADQFNELDTLRKVVWHLTFSPLRQAWSVFDDDAKSNGLDIAALQKEMGK